MKQPLLVGGLFRSVLPNIRVSCCSRSAIWHLKGPGQQSWSLARGPCLSAGLWVCPAPPGSRTRIRRKADIPFTPARFPGWRRQGGHHGAGSCARVCVGGSVGAFDPLGGSAFGGWLSISPIHRRFTVTFPDPWIVDTSAIFQLGCTCIHICNI